MMFYFYFVTHMFDYDLSFDRTQFTLKINLSGDPIMTALKTMFEGWMVGWSTTQKYTRYILTFRCNTTVALGGFVFFSFSYTRKKCVQISSNKHPNNLNLHHSSAVHITPRLHENISRQMKKTLLHDINIVENQVKDYN